MSSHRAAWTAHFVGGCLLLGLSANVRAQDIAPRVVVEVIDVSAARERLTARGSHVQLRAGEVDPLGIRQPSSGRLVRWSHSAGAFVVWSLRALVRHGETSMRLELLAANEDAVGVRVGTGARTGWTSPSAGVPLSRAGPIILHPGVTSGEAVSFEVAVPVANYRQPKMIAPSLRYRLVSNHLHASAPRAVTVPLPRLLGNGQLR